MGSALAVIQLSQQMKLSKVHLKKGIRKRSHYCLSLTELIFCCQLTTLMFYSGTTVLNYEHSAKCLNFLHYFHEFNSNISNKLAFKCSMLLLTKAYFSIRESNEI